MAECKDCRFWKAWSHMTTAGEKPDGRGECRRFPPAVVVLPLSVGGSTDRATPVTGAFYWCGEYKKAVGK